MICVNYKNCIYYDKAFGKNNFIFRSIRINPDNSKSYFLCILNMLQPFVNIRQFLLETFLDNWSNRCNYKLDDKTRNKFPCAHLPFLDSDLIVWMINRFSKMYQIVMSSCKITKKMLWMRQFSDSYNSVQNIVISYWDIAVQFYLIIQILGL